MSLKMRIFALLSSVACLAIPAAAQQQERARLTLTRLTENPDLNGSAPHGLQFSPDGSRVTFLRPSAGDSAVLDLWEYNLAAQKSRLLVAAETITGGQEKLSQAERARRERMRITSGGIVAYSWSKDGSKLLFPLGGDLYQYRLDSGETQQLTHSNAAEIDSRFSPQGRYISYILDDNIHVIAAATGQNRQMTTSTSPTLKNGSADFIAMEELDRDTGYWWSEDEKYIAFIQYDEAPVDTIQRYEINRDDFKLLAERYPRAGSRNVTVKLGIMTVDSGQTVWVDLGDDPDIYLARVQWLPDSSGLFFQRLSRDQKRLDVIFAAAEDGRTQPVLSETSSYWINLHHNLRFIRAGREFFWTSERSGFNHLYHYKRDGTLIGQLTTGPWVVTALSQVDEATGAVYFTGHADSPLEQHLYQSNLQNHAVAAPTRLSETGGWHTVVFPVRGTAYIDHYSDPNTPPQVSLHDGAGQRLAWIDDNALTADHPYFPFREGHITPVFGHFTGPDGQTLYYRLYKPAGIRPGQKYPVIFSLYGGPGVQMVRRVWDQPFHQLLAQNGYGVFTLDNRGSSNRGTAFERPIYHQFAQAEIADQVAGAEFLKQFDFVDTDRIGVLGHSYGGYMALMALFKAPDIFKVGVAGAPVTDWQLYDTAYTERYLGHPDDNKDGYDKSSVLPYVDGLSGKLLLIHGMADDNVVFNNSSLLLDELQKKAMVFDFMAYPGETHRIGSTPLRERHRLMTIKNYFDDHL